MDARRRIAKVEAGQFDAILGYLDCAGAEPVAQKAGAEGWTRYGGSGTPAVSEFVVAEVGPALGLTANGGRSLIADALDLAYRLPQLFACLHDGSVDAWRVRRVASATREFTIAQAGEADRRLSAVGMCGEPLLARIPRWRIQNGHRLCRYHRSLEPQPVRNHCGAQPWESHATRPGRYLVTGGTTTRLPGRVETARNRRKPHAA